MNNLYYLQSLLDESIAATDGGTKDHEDTYGQMARNYLQRNTPEIAAEIGTTHAAVKAMVKELGELVEGVRRRANATEIACLEDAVAALEAGKALL